MPTINNNINALPNEAGCGTEMSLMPMHREVKILWGRCPGAVVGGDALNNNNDVSPMALLDNICSLRHRRRLALRQWHRRVTVFDGGGVITR